METSLLKALMTKKFYDEHKGASCPNKIFSSDGQKIKAVIDKAMSSYNRTMLTSEVEALFSATNPTLTSAQRLAWKGLFDKIEREPPMGSDVAQDVLMALFRESVGNDIATLGLNYMNGEGGDLSTLRQLLDNYKDNFMPNLVVDWEDVGIDAILQGAELETAWTFNIATLARKLPGVGSGQLVEIGARPNTGKTSAHASFIAGPKGFAHQGANCMILCNEEHVRRVIARYLTACTGMTIKEISTHKVKAAKLWSTISDKVRFKDATGKDLAWVESICKSYKPDVLVLDMGDKFSKVGGWAREDQQLKANAIYARQIAKEYGCVVFYMSQLSAEAEGKTILNQSMMEGSRTGKAAEADLMLLIAKNPAVQGQDEEDQQRHLNVVKNKINGWHGIVHCELNPMTARYSE
jgi:hypothetical protein